MALKRSIKLLKEVLVLVAGLKKIIRHGLCDIGGMSRYDEIINESDLEEYTL